MVLNILMFLISFMGMVVFLHGRTKININFMPILVISLISIIITIGGCMGISLNYVTVFICGIGIAMFVASFILKDVNRKLITPGIIVFLMGMVCIFAYVYNRVFDNWDCFSHWGLTVKLMLTNNCLPSIEDSMLIHYSYPIGSSAFIYYFCQIVNEQEWAMMLGHGMISLSAFISIFSIMKKTTIWKVVLLCLSYIGMVTFIHPLTDIYVDALLPIVAISIIFFIHKYRTEMGKKILYVIPLTIFLLSIKNSGIIFVFFIIVYYIVVNRKMPVKKIVISSFMIMLICCFFMFMWKLHIKLSYEGVEYLAKHDISIENYQNVILTKNKEMAIDVLRIFIKRFFSFTNYEFIVYIMLIISVLYIFMKKTKQYLVFTVIFGVAYMVGLYMTYIFSMDVNEAYELASYDRYYKTALIFVFGFMLIPIVENDFDLTQLIGKLVLGGITICVVTMIYNAAIYDKGIYTAERRIKYSEAIEDVNVTDEIVILCGATEAELGYATVISRYELLYNKVIFINDADKINEYENYILIDLN